MEHFRFYPWPSCDKDSVNRVKEADQAFVQALGADKFVSNASASMLPAHPISENGIRTILKHRRKRDEFFEGDLFADPAWDILLELYAAALGQSRLSTGSVTIGAAVPATTALRWIKSLEAKNLIERKADPLDGRRNFLSLSEGAFDALTSYFKAIGEEKRLI